MAIIAPTENDRGNANSPANHLDNDRKRLSFHGYDIVNEPCIYFQGGEDRHESEDQHESEGEDQHESEGEDRHESEGENQHEGEGEDQHKGEYTRIDCKYIYVYMYIFN